MWISFFAIMIYTGLLTAFLVVRVTKLINDEKKKVEGLRQQIEIMSRRVQDIGSDVYGLGRKIKQIAKYRVTFREIITRAHYHGPSDKYTNEYFIDLESAEAFVKNCKDWSNPVITDLKTNKPIPDDHNMENWERYVAEKLG